MIFLTGDIHGQLDRFGENIFPEQQQMTRNDYVIVLGDCGLIWNPYRDKKEQGRLYEISQMPFTLLFIDGNHECFDRLYSNEFVITDFYGGKAQMISENVIHLLRGEIYTLERKKFFCFGGAKSHDISDGILECNDNRISEWTKEDKEFRINHVSWYKEELPSVEEMEYGLRNLEKHNYKIDYILTHSPSDYHLPYFGDDMESDVLTEYLARIENLSYYQRWYFGHIHKNIQIDNKTYCLYDDIIRLV